MSEARNQHYFHSAIISAPIDEVWEVIKNFEDLSWHPGTETSGWKDDSKVVRRLVIKGNGLVVEEAQVIAPKYQHVYLFTNTPFPGVTLYEGHLKLQPVTLGNQTFATWEAKCHVPEEAQEQIRAIIASVFVGGLETLVARFAKK